VANHQAFALLLLRRIVDAHRALLEAEASRSDDREQDVLGARQRLEQLVHLAAVQFPPSRDAAAEAEGPAVLGA